MSGIKASCNRPKRLKAERHDKGDMGDPAKREEYRRKMALKHSPEEKKKRLRLRRDQKRRG